MYVARLASISPLFVLFALFALPAPSTVAPAANTSSSVDRVQMKGEYLWTQGGDMREPLDATFERIDGERWKATLKFPFDGRRHTWSGEFVGDPLSGRFDGEVEWGRGRRPRRWSVKGSSADGVYKATHTELFRDGRRSRTGSITLRPQ